MDTVHEHYSEIEADWSRFYHRDLRDDLWGDQPLGMRRIRSMLTNLPHDSALRNAAKAHWTDSDAMLALIAELLDAQRRDFIAAHTAPGTRLPPALQIPRPWDTVEPRASGMTLQELAELIGPPVVTKEPTA